MRRSTAKILTLLIVVVMVVALIVCEIAGWNDALFLFELACLMVLAVLSRFLRCPSCGHVPFKGMIFYRYCPYCGEDLDFE
jgi:hypothetical protein